MVLEFKSPFSNGMDASLVIGQKDFSAGTSMTTQDGFSYPYHLGFDSSGNLWVPDSINNRVLEFSSTAVPEFPTASLEIIALVSMAVIALVLRRFPIRLGER
jgi:DNA-binding beta-propeller fold protein YncE